MRIFVMTDIGNAFASRPEREPSDGLKVLYWMRRHSWKATDEQLENFVIPDKWQLQKTLQNLVKNKAIQEVG